MSLVAVLGLFVCLTSRCVEIHAVSIQEIQFYQVSDPQLGIQVIGESFPSNSIITCALGCRSRYSTVCESFIYDPVTNRCSPGGELGTAETKIQAGQRIYSVWTTMCDRSRNYSFPLLRQFGFCVLMSQYQTRFSSAEAECIKVNGHQITVKTQEKKNFLLNCSSIIHTQKIGVGLSGNVTANDFRWSDGLAITDDERAIAFKQGYPINVFGEENCCYFSATLPNPGVVNDFCYKNYDFICEYSF